MLTRLAALIVKELLAAFRDPRARASLILPPILQLFLFAFAATLEVSNVPVGVINDDWGAASVRLLSRFERASAFSEIRRYRSLREAQAALVIPVSLAFLAYPSGPEVPAPEPAR